MIARHLSTALMETIQQHAETYHGGKMDLERTLSAIGDIASGFLAELTTAEERADHYIALTSGIMKATGHKVAQDTRLTTPQ